MHRSKIRPMQMFCKEIIKMSDFFNLIYDAALNYKNKILTNDSEYRELISKINILSDRYKELELTEEQRQIIDEMIHTGDLLNEKEMQAIYKKGILHCAEILKELRLLE